MQASDYRNVHTEHQHQHYRCNSHAAASTSDPAALDTLTKGDVIEAVNYGLASGRNIRTLLQALNKAGCPADRSFFHVERCEGAVGGGFAPGYGVVLCHNRLHSRREVLAAMSHELLHAYDHCRGGCGGAGLDSNSTAVVRGATNVNAVDSGIPTGGSEGCSSSGAGCSSSSCSTTIAATGTTAGTTLGTSAASISQEGASVGGGKGDGGVVAAVGGRVGCAVGAVEESLPEGAEGGGRGEGDGSDGAGLSGNGFSDWRCGGGMDWHNCDQHVCSEIRAANLSGDCSILQELLRGNLPMLPTQWGDQQLACVARRAALSAALNPGCGGQQGAEAAVDRLLTICLADTEPLGPGEAVARP